MTVDWLTKLCSVKIRCHSLSKTLATFVSKKAIFFWQNWQQVWT